MARGPDRVVRVTRASAREEAQFRAFARRMPKRVPIKVFNTGVGLREGDPDPHWQLVAVSNGPTFKPRPAVVTRVDMPRTNEFQMSVTYLDTTQVTAQVDATRVLVNDPARSQWISTADGPSGLPNGVTYTFRTTFELTDMLPETVVLRAQFLSRRQVKAVRLNGKATPPVVGHAFNPRDVEKELVEGTNTLEIDVGNDADSTSRSPASPMLLRVELGGSFVCTHQQCASRGKEAPQ